jgi:hypothetical protein
MRHSTLFKGPTSCSDDCAFAGVTDIRKFDHPRFAVDGLKAAEELAAIPMLAITGTFYVSVPLEEFPVVPFHPDVVAQARSVRGRPPPDRSPQERKRNEKRNKERKRR